MKCIGYRKDRGEETCWRRRNLTGSEGVIVFDSTFVFAIEMEGMAFSGEDEV